MPYIDSIERLGIEKGLRDGLLEGIEVCLEIKFGQEGLNLMPEIRQIADFEKLEAILQAIKSASSPDELRKAWA